MSIFGAQPQRDELKKLSTEAMEFTAVMQNRVLKPAALAYILGGPERLDLDDAFASSAWTRLSRRFQSLWSMDYFEWLFSVPDSFDRQEELRRWVSILRDHALTVLTELEAEMPLRSGRRYRARTNARNRFWGAFYNQFQFMRRDMHDTAARS